MNQNVTDQVLLNAEELDHRIAPTLGDLGGIVLTVPTITCPPPPTDTCPPPPSDTCPPPPSDDTSGGNNGYGNGGFDGVPGDSADNPSPSADEKEADIVR